VISRLVAVTGATGFLGRHLVRALADDGWIVRILARRDPIDPLWAGIEPEAVLGDLADEAALRRLCEGADAVIHTAGLVKASRRAAFDEVNVDGARRVAEAADGVPHVLLVSSLAAREPHLSHYAASKRDGETAAAAVLGARLTVVRPPAIYGPGDRETLPLFHAAATSPVLPVLDPRARIALIHVADAARQISALAAAPPAGGVWALCDGRPEGYSWVELMTAAAGAFGRSPRLVRVPDALLKVIAAASQAGSRLGGAPAMLTPGKARELLHPDWSLRADEQRAGLPAATFGLADGFADMVERCAVAGLRRQT
jgi:nucleoside-diphosphate-sugar epimerase